MAPPLIVAPFSVRPLASTMTLPPELLTVDPDRWRARLREHLDGAGIGDRLAVQGVAGAADIEDAVVFQDAVAQHRVAGEVELTVVRDLAVRRQIDERAIGGATLVSTARRQPKDGAHQRRRSLRR